MGDLIYDNLIPAILILISLILTVTLLIYKQRKNIELNNISESILNYQRPKSNFKFGGKNLINLNKQLQWLPYPMNWFISKDLIRLKRSKKLETIYLLFFIFIGLIISLLGFYLVDLRTGIGFSGDYITVLFGIFGSMSIIFGLVNKMGIDYEGKQIDILRSIPNISKHLIGGKFLLYCFVGLPLSLITYVIPYIFYPISIIQLLIIWGVTTPVFIIVAILSSMLYPNFNYETIFDLPTTKSKITYIFLSTFFMMIINFIWFFVPQPFSFILLPITCIGATVALLLLTSKKLEEDDYNRNISLESIVK